MNNENKFAGSWSSYENFDRLTDCRLLDENVMMESLVSQEKM